MTDFVLDVSVAARWVAALKIPAVPTMLLLTDAMKIAIGFNRTVYDSVYLALASASGRPPVTADERMVNAVGASLPVRWLGSMGSAT